MNNIDKLFNAWSNELPPVTPATREKWFEIMEYLYTNCSESVREDISTFILDYSKLAQQQAYTAGFRQAFLLWLNSVAS